MVQRVGKLQTASTLVRMGAILSTFTLSEEGDICLVEHALFWLNDQTVHVQLLKDSAEVFHMKGWGGAGHEHVI